MPGIVVGVDSSAHALDALRWALQQAETHGQNVTAVAVWQGSYLPEDVGREVADDLNRSAEEGARHVVHKQLNAALEGKPIPAYVQVLVRQGNPASVLTELAADADLLVVGARGRGGFRHLLLGSVADQLVHHAPCPIVVIPGARPARSAA